MISQWIDNAGWLISGALTGGSAVYTYMAVWRRWKVKHRYHLQFKEHITDEKHELQAMILNLKMTVHRLTRKVEEKDERLERLHKIINRLNERLKAAEGGVK